MPRYKPRLGRPPQSPILSGYKEIARYIGCHERTLRRYCYKFACPVFHMNHRVFAFKSDVLSWLKIYDKVVKRV